MYLSDKTITKFTIELASKAPIPGGGGAAALTGALGAALCAMAGNLTVGRKKYADVEADAFEIIEKAENLRAKMVSLIDKDAEMFAPLAEAYSVPKDEPKRAEILESATIQACMAPMEMLRCSCECTAIVEEMLEKGSKMLISDVGCGAINCEAAMRSAALNVFVNTKTLICRENAEKLEDEVNNLLNEYIPRARRVADEVEKYLRG